MPSAEIETGQVKGTFEGYALWALRRYAQLNGLREGTALTKAIDQWLKLSRAELQDDYGISLEAYWLETQGAEVVPMPHKSGSVQSRSKS